MRRSWIAIPLALLLVAGLAPSVWANTEMHPGARLFFPLWDVSTPSRLTFIVITREARRAGSAINPVLSGTFLSGSPTNISRFKVVGTPGNCIPRGAGGSSANVNRTDLTGLGGGNPVFVDDLHFEWYGKSCRSNDEVVHMSCADIDLFLLAAPDNKDGLRPRLAFDSVAGEGRGALDVNLIVNSSFSPGSRKNDPYGTYLFKSASHADKRHSIDNSLMGHAIISDVTEGWAATYPAAAARTTSCRYCGTIDQGTNVGYENYPMEVMLPFALADSFSAVPSGAANPLRNVLSLWGPGLLAGQNLESTSIDTEIVWWDGRERAFITSAIAHSLVRPLGGTLIPGLDNPLDGKFSVSTFVCGHAGAGQAENDGFPRAQTSPGGLGCGAPTTPDTADPSDNFAGQAIASGDITGNGHSIQSSTPIGWWRFRLKSDGKPPAAIQSATILQPKLSNNITGFSAVHSGRGLVGVVLSSKIGAGGNGVGDATRLWHKEGCHMAQSNLSIGPPHVGDRFDGLGRGSPETFTPLFNVFSSKDQYNRICQPD